MSEEDKQDLTPANADDPAETTKPGDEQSPAAVKPIADQQNATDDAKSVAPAAANGMALKTRIWGAIQWLGSAARNHKASISLLAVFVAVIGFYIRPFTPPAENETDQVESSWSDTIKRLNIEPVFPPQEDMFVGDIYLSLVKRVGAIIPSPKEGEKRTLHGQWVSIARSKIIASVRPRPFEFVGLPPAPPPSTQGQTTSTPATSSPAPTVPVAITPAPTSLTSTAAPQPAGLPDDTQLPKMNLYLTAFPGVTVRNHVETGANLWQVAFGRKEAETVEMLIDPVYTYSMPAAEAILALAKFCSDADTAEMCTDAIARKTLSFVFGENVYLKDDKGYVYNITVSLLRQVFVTTRLQTARYRGDSLTGGFSDRPKEDQEPGSNNAPGAPATPGTPVSTPEERNSQRVRRQDSFSSRMGLDTTFARPIAFGHRRVSFAIPASMPTAPTKATEK